MTNMHDATRTPGPWKVILDERDENIMTSHYAIVGNTNAPTVVARLPDGLGAWSEQHANASYIVRAVNAHADLVAALEVAEATIERLNRHSSANGTLDVIRAALAAAKAKP